MICGLSGPVSFLFQAYYPQHLCLWSPFHRPYECQSRIVRKRIPDRPLAPETILIGFLFVPPSRPWPPVAARARGRPWPLVAVAARGLPWTPVAMATRGRPLPKRKSCVFNRGAIWGSSVCIGILRKIMIAHDFLGFIFLVTLLQKNPLSKLILLHLQNQVSLSLQ